MPYTKEHKARSRKNILKSAFYLFAERGFDAVTIDMIMKNCNLTRGAFYSHFTSKANLYKEALADAVNNTNLVSLKPNHLSEKEWLGLLLDGYLSIEHVQGTNPCPLAFLVIDIAIRDKDTKDAYTNIFKGMNKSILKLIRSYASCDEGKILAITAMIIGSVAIARVMDDKDSIIELLSSSRTQIDLMLKGI